MQDPQIPPLAQPPVRPPAPSVFGLPNLPDDIIDLILQYGPYVVLATAVLGGFSAAGLFMAAGASGGGLPGVVVVGAVVNLVAAALMGASYLLLVQKRRIGWNMLTAALVIMLATRLLDGGLASILYFGIEAGLTAYVMLQIRGYYTIG